MAKSRIDEALAALKAAGDGGFGARREVLERLGLDLLHRPALGGQTLVDAVEGALELARGQGRITSAHSLLFAQLWTRIGLPAPAALELQPEEVIPATGRRASNPAEDDALLEGLFAELIQQAEGEPLALHHALTESFPAMPPEMRDHVVAHSVGRSDPIHADLACYWLLDPTPRIRHAAARGLANRLVSGDLPRHILATLVVLRSWMPEDAARAQVDSILKEAMRTGVATIADQAPWTIHGIRATLPDGGGKRSVAVRQGRRSIQATAA